MDSNSQYFIALLTAFLKGSVPPKPINIDWCKIYDLANMHSLGGAVFLAVQRLENSDKPVPSILNKFKSDFFYAAMRYEEQEKAYREITEKLCQEKVEHLFFKGIIIREYYPVKQVRILGDIDLLLHESDQDVVRKLFTEMGYKNQSSKLHEKYEKGKILIEAHDKIINTQINSKVDYFAYFDKAWDHAIPKENKYTCELELNYHLVFLLAHIAKHFNDFGAGVRMIFDIAVILQKYGDMLDFSYIWKELKEIKLDIFARNIFGLCDRWFQVKTPDMEFEMDDLTLSSMSKYIFDGGTFGYSNDNIAISAIRREYSKSENHKIIQFKAFWGKIFLNFNEMREKYSFLKKRPFLLPFAWIHRWYKSIIKRRSRTLRILKGLYKCSEEAEQSYDMMKKIGL